MLRVHHLDCATLCTLAPRLVVGPDHPGMVCHALLVETDAGLVLVDAGLGTHDVRAPIERLGRGFNWVVRPRLDEAQTAVRQVERLGYTAADVRHIVLTHLDLDHAGGMSDFPNAKVHVTLQEHEAAMLASTFKEQRRYRGAQWAHWPDFELYRTRGTQWFGFDAVDQLRGLPPEILLVPLFGHTRGHAGVAVHTTDGWQLHAGDAYFHRATVEGGRVPLALRISERIFDMDVTARMANQVRLGALARSGDARVFCAHDPVEFARLSPRHGAPCASPSPSPS
ncbi:MAG: MBL fold metallo-hydrolase [Pseudomonadota bacterium]|nr:MBL fold metallo-hydrolase [Pseudomonadota bacterium]